MGLVLLGVLLVVAVAVARATQAGDAPRASRRPPSLDRAWRARREQARQRRLLPRPAADQPPPDLPPLIPSPRVVAREVERGLRDLEDWLGREASA